MSLLKRAGKGNNRFSRFEATPDHLSPTHVSRCSRVLMSFRVLRIVEIRPTTDHESETFDVLYLKRVTKASEKGECSTAKLDDQETWTFIHRNYEKQSQR